MLRKMLGPELVFIVLNLDSESQEARLRARHTRAHDQELVHMLKKMHEFYEPADTDEDSAYNIMITKDMTEDDVMEKALEIINGLDKM